MLQDVAFFFLNGNAGKVAHMLVTPGKPVKQGGFAAVLVSHQCEQKTHKSIAPLILSDRNLSDSSVCDVIVTLWKRHGLRFLQPLPAGW